MTDANSADEQNEVLQTLLEQEPSAPTLVRHVFSQVQTEFTAWHITQCRQVLTSLADSSTWQSCLHPDFRSPSLASIPATLKLLQDVRTVVSETDSPLFIQVYSQEGVVTKTSSVKLEVIHMSFPLEPHPPYESCSPLYRNVFKGDDSDNMNFIPYADDHTFNQVNHTHHYGSLSWQDSFDPDLEVIVLEAVYRLQNQYALTYGEIDNCNVLPLRLYPQPGKFGVLSTLRRRDHLHWTGNTIPTSFTFSPSKPPAKYGFRSRLETLNALFCPNLNCLESLCSVHVEPNSLPLIPQPPSSHIPGEVTNPCGSQCFVDNKIEETNFSWDEADLDTFKVISKLLPEVTPCVLAEICLKPCNEVFYHRKLLHSGTPDGVRSTGIKNRRCTPKFNDKNPVHFTPNDPCRHAGSCSRFSDCLCFRNQSHCQRNCRCSQDCTRRWQGCRCSSTRSRWSCVTGRCPCVEAFRECDPELCVNCRCMVLVGDTSCRNSQIQFSTHKGLEVKKSDWGLGAFLTEPAKAGDLITEYIGELIYEPTVESRGDLATHRNRCYVFDLNNTFSLDSAYSGNISRFIDHSDAARSRRVNSHAQVRLVNGDHRIGIFASRDIEAGSQILMDYGPVFFAG